MTPLPTCRALILKVASRCNLNCTYCYMYNAGDTTYRQQPKFMSRAVAEALLQSVRRHCARHGITHFTFIFHGGEPLLADQRFYEWFVGRAREVLRPAVRSFFALQTNGVLLTEAWCDLLARLDVSLGISLDGTPEINDKFRVDHQHKSSYAPAVRGLQLAQRSRSRRHHPGVLCVIDVSADPLAVYRHFKELAVSRVNFLLPYCTHDKPPPVPAGTGSATPYADWLLAIFDQWYEEKAPKPRIQLFEQVIELILGIDRGFEYLGGRDLEFLVVETDGGIEAVGALKLCGNGFTKAGMNVLHHELDEALQTDLARLYHQSHHQLPAQCTTCPVVAVCGGGFLPNRYSRQNGFANPSVFCLDLAKLITHVQNKILASLPHSLLAEEEWIPLSFEEVRRSLRA